MKVNVIKRYVDRYTKVIKEVGTVEDYPDSRAERLISQGYAEAVDKKKTAQKKGAEN